MTALSALPLLAGLLLLSLAVRRIVGRRQLARIIFEADTPAGKGFDLVLLMAIVLSVLVVTLESDPLLQQRHQTLFMPVELGFSLLFSLEYLLRLLCSPEPLRYARSFFGIVDFLSSIPPLMGLRATQGKYLVVIRILRLLRVFRILKLGLYLQEASILRRALIASRRKILVFLLTMVTLVVIIGALMYVIEGERGGFRSIPVGIYWAIVTITTVGYGDVTPITPLGRIAASAVMLLGYSIIAVPTGIVTAELGAAAALERQGSRALTECLRCGEKENLPKANHCHQCGASLHARPDQGRRSIT
jgi:voltage-gated potassium channel